jgi:DNA-binding HxlR family transcriptional regulator
LHTQLLGDVDLEWFISCCQRGGPSSLVGFHPSQFHHHVGPVQLELLRPRLLEAEGWLTRHYEPTVPPQVTYEIIKRVLELDGVVTELDRIAERWYGKSGKGT